MSKQICLNRSVLDFVESKLTPDSFVIEFGGGWSSRWFADRCGHLMVFETDKKWSALIMRELAGHKCNWHVINRFPDDGAEDADLVLVDCLKHLRHEAAKLAWKFLKPGGWLLFDDAQRPQHAMSVEWLNSIAGQGHVLKWQPGDVESARERLTIAWQK